MIPDEHATIAAISTAVGHGAISIVRMSGAQAFEIIAQLFVAKKTSAIKSHTIKYGHIVHKDKVIDEVMVSFFVAPHSYTTEHIVEINCHGGDTTATAILDLLIAHGAVHAGAGEFTKRAFLNGRIDLSQAEAVVGIINANTKVHRDMSVSLLAGGLSEQITALRTNLLSAIAALEVAIDYPEEEYFAGYDQVSETLAQVQGQVSKLITNSQNFDVLKNGLSTAIVGRPNVGKSSLLNALLREDRAIVTDIAGTTRDIITAPINIGHVPIQLVDTAGLRETADIVEQIGQERTKQAQERADLVLCVFDSSQPITPEDIAIIEGVQNTRKIIIANKQDLGSQLDTVLLEAHGQVEGSPPPMVVTLSAQTGEGIVELEQAIMSLYPDIDVSGELTMANGRQLAHLQRVQNFIELANTSIGDMASEEFVSLDITNAYLELGYILGEEVDESIIDKIFAQFCLGK